MMQTLYKCNCIIFDANLDYSQCHVCMTPLTLKMKNLTLEYEITVYGMLKYAFISVVAVMLANWHGKSILQTTDMTFYKCNCIIFVVCEMLFPSQSPHVTATTDMNAYFSMP